MAISNFDVHVYLKHHLNPLTISYDIDIDDIDTFDYEKFHDMVIYYFMNASNPQTFYVNSSPKRLLWSQSENGDDYTFNLFGESEMSLGATQNVVSIKLDNIVVITTAIATFPNVQTTLPYDANQPLEYHYTRLYVLYTGSATQMVLKFDLSYGKEDIYPKIEEFYNQLRTVGRYDTYLSTGLLRRATIFHKPKLINGFIWDRVKGVLVVPEPPDPDSEP